MGDARSGIGSLIDDWLLNIENLRNSALIVLIQYPVVQSKFGKYKCGILQVLFLSQRPQGTQRYRYLIIF